MKITVVKKGSFSVKPMMSCPALVDDDGVNTPKK